MQELIARIKDQVGLDDGKAQQAAQVVIDFLKQRLPAGMAGQVDGLLGSGQSSAAENIGKQAGRLLG